METQKLIEKLNEIEARYLAATKEDPTSSSSKQKLNASKTAKSILRKRMRFFDLYDDDEARYSVIERAGCLLSCLENDVPHFVKFMLHSNVGQGFWLHLPKKFCDAYMPHQDTNVALVNEWGKEYEASFLLGRYGLSAGWRGFSISHRLLKGDILIFHLIQPCKFKVHIVRANRSEVMGAALCLMGLRTADHGKKDSRKRRKTTVYIDPFLLDHSADAEGGEMANRGQGSGCYTLIHSHSQLLERMACM